MNPRLSLLIVALALVVAPSLARAAGSWSVMLGGGMTVPTGDFGDGAKSGFNFGGGVDYSVNDMLAVGIDGAWNNNEHKDVGTSFGGFTLNEDKFTILQVGAHLRAMAPTTGPVKPYGIIGVGMYNLKEKYTYTDDTTGQKYTEADDIAAGFFEQIGTRPGGKIGAGAMYQASERVGVGLEICYNFVSLDKAKSGSSSAQYVGAHAGLMFSLMPSK